MDKKELEAEVRAAENKAQRAKSEHANVQEEWLGRLREIDKERRELENELKAVDKAAERMKKFGVPVMPEKVDEEKADLATKIAEVKERRIDVQAQAQGELDALVEKANAALKELEEAKALLAAINRYEQTLVK